MKKKSRKGGSKRGSASCRAWFTTRNGRRIYASDYGYQGWPIGQ